MCYNFYKIEMQNNIDPDPNNMDNGTKLFILLLYTITMNLQQDH